MHIKKQTYRRRIGAVVAVLCGLAVLAAAIWCGVFNQPMQDTLDKSAQEAVKQEPYPVSLRSNALFFGNMYWGRYINDWSMKSPLKTAYPFSRLNEFNRDAYDAWITGLECPTVAGFNQTSAEEDETLSFNCSPDYLPEAAKWFTAVTLANNHTDNRGEAGFVETKQHLEENGIQYFGHYDPYLAEEACEVVAFPVTVTYSDATTRKQNAPMAFCGFHGVFKIPPAETIQQIARYAKLMPVIAMPHMGVEYEPAPDQLKTSIYRSLIDAGADVVLGDHPHWIQTTEAYKGKLIVYSMGNFMFDQQMGSEVTRSAAINVDINTTNATDASSTDGNDAARQNLKKWLSIGDSCAAFKDACLEQAEKLKLSKLSLTFDFGVIGTNDSDKIVKPATEAQQQSILSRLNWSTTISGLQYPYSGH